MERKRWLQSKVLSYYIVLIGMSAALSGCTNHLDGKKEQEKITIVFDSVNPSCRSSDPSEDKISDVSLWILDEYGRIEEHLWLNKDIGRSCEVSVITGKKYRFAACANFGYNISANDTETLYNTRFHLAYPDEYRAGIPMVAETDYIDVSKQKEVPLKFIRLMSKISIRIDRSRLSEDVEMYIRGIKIGNCPRSATIFHDSSVRNSDDCFPLGFCRTEEECRELNIVESNGISYPVCLYMLENIQGQFSDTPISDDSQKVFDTYDPRREKCSYIELDIDYISSDKISKDGYLKYRFYLGEDRNDLNIERNCLYQITIAPEDDGLKEDSWRVDKSHITSTQLPTFSYYPEGYIRGDIGESIHLGCRFTPIDAAFDVGLEYMENDKKEGIYDYVIDDDGHGATITLTGPGCGLIYMSVGPPVNDAALWFIEVNQPTESL